MPSQPKDWVFLLVSECDRSFEGTTEPTPEVMTSSMDEITPLPSSTFGFSLFLSNDGPSIKPPVDSATPASPIAATTTFARSTYGFSNITGSSVDPAVQHSFSSSSNPGFRATNTPTFGAPTTSAFGAATTPTIGSQPTSTFGPGGGFHTPAFGSTHNPAFGATSDAFTFGTSTSPAFGAQLFNLFGSCPAFGQTNYGFGSNYFGSTASYFGSQSSSFDHSDPFRFLGFSRCLLEVRYERWSTTTWWKQSNGLQYYS